MKRRLLIAGLTLGTLAGYGAGFMSLRCHADRRAGFERHVARICVDAARSGAPEANPPPPPRRGW